jgi:hypothetical protein
MASSKRALLIYHVRSGIRLLKFFSWEEHWVDSAKEAREEELVWRFKSNVNNSYVNALWCAHQSNPSIFGGASNSEKKDYRAITPAVITLLAFLSWTKIFHQPLSVPVAFTTIALLAMAQDRITSMSSAIVSALPDVDSLTFVSQDYLA